jgi:hypothetical protein
MPIHYFYYKCQMDMQWKIFVDELGEDEIMEESGKLFFFLWYLDKQ